MTTKTTSPIAQILSWVLLGFAAVAGLASASFAYMIARFAGQLSTQQLVLQVVIIVAFGAIAMLMVLLRNLVASSTKDPFTRKNAARLRLLGLFAVVWQASELLLAFTGHNVNLVSIRGLRLRLAEADTVSVSGLIMVCAVFVLAHIFAKGAEMREELEGTV